MSIPAGYRCLECEGYTSADDTVSTGHYAGCSMLSFVCVWNREVKAWLPRKPVPRGDEWSGPRKIDPPPNPLILANHAEVNRIMTELVAAEERWLMLSLGARGLPLDAATVDRCLLKTRTDHLPNGLRYEAVLEIDGCAVEPPFIWTLTYEGVPP